MRVIRMKEWLNRHERQLDTLVLVVLFGCCTAISGWLFPRYANTLLLLPRILLLAPLVLYLWYRKIVPLTLTNIAFFAFLPILATGIAMITEMLL